MKRIAFCLAAFVAIHSQATTDPGETLSALFSTLRDELATTEMFISAFYGVVDRTRGELLYANTGHPHAFVVGADGSCQRLAAQDPPLGMADGQPVTVRRPWDPGNDLLVLFTDGLSDARSRAGPRLGEEALLETIQRYRTETPSDILEHLIDLVNAHSGDVPRRDDQTIVLLHS